MINSLIYGDLLRQWLSLGSDNSVYGAINVAKNHQALLGLI
ncbi:hypothetical protein [Thiolinea disciformis]|nr:hypothetical protein [Thiolinea disciformis]